MPGLRPILRPKIFLGIESLASQPDGWCSQWGAILDGRNTAKLWPELELQICCVNSRIALLLSKYLIDKTD